MDAFLTAALRGMEPVIVSVGAVIAALTSKVELPDYWEKRGIIMHSKKESEENEEWGEDREDWDEEKLWYKNINK